VSGWQQTWNGFVRTWKNVVNEVDVAAENMSAGIQIFKYKTLSDITDTKKDASARTGFNVDIEIFIQNLGVTKTAKTVEALQIFLRRSSEIEGCCPFHCWR
jgi:hypothetical protein